MFSHTVVLVLLIVIGGISLSPILEYSSSFPVHTNSSFQLILSAKKEYTFFAIMRVEIIDNDNVVSKTLIYPGIADQLEDKVANQFFVLENWFKDSNSRIHLFLRLQEAANGLYLCVSFKEPNNMADKRTSLKVPCNKQALLLAKIQLTVDPSLDLTITTKDGRTDGVHHNDVAKISCVSRNGVPPQPPSLSHSSSILVKTRQFLRDTNTILLYFLASIADHGKIVSCIAGRSSTSITIHVFHNPSAVHLNPAFYSYLPNGTSVACISSNGYPTPTVTWTFINGPPEATKYYKISPSNNLTMFPNAPIGSSWVFNCSAINSITSSYDSGITRTFNFKIYPINNTMTNVLVVLISVAAALVIVIIIVCNRQRIRKHMKTFMDSRSGTNKDPGDDPLNNFPQSVFTYATVAGSVEDSGAESESKKPTRKSRRNKTKRDNDIDEEDNIV